MEFISQIINGLGLGSIYALVALGYSMVYGIVQLINFAHGDIIMVGSYATYVVFIMMGLPLWLAMILSILFCAIMGIFIEKVAYQRLLDKGAPRISLLITAIGVSIFLQNLSQLIFSSSGKAIPNVIPSFPVLLGSLQVSSVTIITIIVSVVLMITLQILVKKTKMGKAMRATSEDSGAAQLMGINPKNTIAFTFGIGSALAAVGAILYCGAYAQITPYMGSMLGLKAFVAAVLGGIGSIPGAMIGGYLIAIAESLTKALGGSQITDAVVFGILIIVLLVKPTGLLGKNVKEKV
ncbi:MAG: branched-chain amino acid ABC transporter permease [Oscillospiraceae bacterium]